MNNIVIAIDGPAAAGKGTIASHVAAYYGIDYLDSGIFYRTIAFLILENNIDINDVENIVAIAKKLNIIYKRYEVFIGDRNISNEIRTEKVDLTAALVSGIKEVRLIVNDLIRAYVGERDCVIDGRDITSVVYPNAKYKFYLEADADERARRRFNEYVERGIDTEFERVFEDLKLRDFYDKTKEFGALTKTEDAHIIDTSNKTIENIIKEIIDIIGSELR